MESKLNPLYSTPVAILIGSVIVAFAILVNGGYIKLGKANTLGTNTGMPAASGAPAAVNVEVGKLPIQGDNKAKVTVIEFADFQCPFCGAVTGFQQNSSLVASLKQRDPSWTPYMPGILEDYVKSGKVKFAYRDYPFLGQESLDSANAARCANEQGKFWQYHDKLFISQNGENQGNFSKDNLKKFAADLGLNTTQFNTCVDQNKFAADVQADFTAGQAAGVDGTPALYVNNKLLSGAVSYSTVKAAIDAALK